MRYGPRNTVRAVPKQVVGLATLLPHSLLLGYDVAVFRDLHLPLLEVDGAPVANIADVYRLIRAARGKYTVRLVWGSRARGKVSRKAALGPGRLLYASHRNLPHPPPGPWITFTFARNKVIVLPLAESRCVTEELMARHGINADASADVKRACAEGNGRDQPGAAAEAKHGAAVEADGTSGGTSGGRSGGRGSGSGSGSGGGGGPKKGSAAGRRRR